MSEKKLIVMSLSPQSVASLAATCSLAASEVRKLLSMPSYPYWMSGPHYNYVYVLLMGCAY